MIPFQSQEGCFAHSGQDPVGGCQPRAALPGRRFVARATSLCRWAGLLLPFRQKKYCRCRVSIMYRRPLVADRWSPEERRKGTGPDIKTPHMDLSRFCAPDPGHGVRQAFTISATRRCAGTSEEYHVAVLMRDPMSVSKTGEQRLQFTALFANGFARLESSRRIPRHQ